MLKKDGRNLLVNTKIRSIHFVNIVMLCECTLCVVNVLFYTAFCLYVCIFFLCATILVNKDVYIYRLCVPFTFLTNRRRPPSPGSTAISWARLHPGRVMNIAAAGIISAAAVCCAN